MKNLLRGFIINKLFEIIHYFLTHRYKSIAAFSKNIV
jgi:hypothetical protein